MSAKRRARLRWVTLGLAIGLIASVVACGWLEGGTPRIRVDTPTTGTRTETEVTWPTGAVDSSARGRLASSTIAAIDASPVPVLVPSASDVLEIGQFVELKSGYVFTAETEEYGLDIVATAVAYIYPQEDLDISHSASSSATIQWEESEGEQTGRASLSRFGAAYLFKVYCHTASPCGPFRSASLADDLAYVGGRGAGQGAGVVQ